MFKVGIQDFDSKGKNYFLILKFLKCVLYQNSNNKSIDILHKTMVLEFFLLYFRKIDKAEGDLESNFVFVIKASFLKNVEIEAVILLFIN